MKPWSRANTAERVIYVAAGAVGAGLIAQQVWPEKTRAIQEEIVDEIPGIENPPPVSTTLAPTPETTTATQPTDCIDVASMPLDAQVGATIMLLAEANQMDNLRQAMQSNRIGGFAFTSSDFELSDQIPYNGQTVTFQQATSSLISDVESVVGPGLVTFGLDEEGGVVQRTKTLPGFDHLPTAFQQSLMTDEQLEATWAAHGQKLRALGVDVVLGPVLDTGTGDDSYIGKLGRSYGNDPAAVYTKTSAVTRGLQSAGVRGVLKHYPDHGSVETDSHNSAGRSLELSILSSSGALPAYQTFFEQSPPYGVMTNHLSTPGLTDLESGQPGSLSPGVYNMLRQQGFDGVAMTDALNMGAVREYVGGSSGQDAQANAAVMALQAGADMVIVTLDSADQVAGSIETAVTNGSLSPERLQQAAGRVWSGAGADICS